MRPGALLLIVPLWLAAPASVGAQSAQLPGVNESIRRAQLLEEAGDVEAAESLLLELHSVDPESVPILLALEGLLRRAHELDHILAPIAGHLSLRPRSVEARSMQLRVLSELDSTSALTAAETAWLEADPLAADPYRTISSNRLAHGDTVGALEVLEDGFGRVVERSELALPLADLRILAGADDQVGTLFGELLADRPERGEEVAERLARLRVDVRPAVAAGVTTVLDALDSPPHLLASIAVNLAGDRPGEARRVAEAGRGRYVGDELRGFLNETVRLAREGGDAELAEWAMARIRAQQDSEREARRVQVEEDRIAAGALQTGDTARALASRRRALDAFDVGTEDRRRALAAWLRLEAVAGDLDAALDGLRELREDYDGAPELDEAAALVARRLVLEGRESEAPDALSGAEGPLALRETGMLLLLASQFDGARPALIQSARGLDPDEATDVLALVATAARLEPDAAAAVGTGFALAHFGLVDEAYALLDRGLNEFAEDSVAVPAFLAVAGRVADTRGDRERALRLRAEIVDDHSASAEWPEAALHVARALMQEGDEGAVAAKALLERVVLEHPGHPLAPDARRALDRLAGGFE